MDIRCPSCSTLYEFDDDRVTDRGVNVRCSACGQVFKVRRTIDDAPKITWMVKRESTGEIINFEDLSTLQRWIIEQKVSRRDLISKTGESWKTLGAISELQAFFKVVDELNEPRDTSRDTDGYLTAEQRVPSASGEVPGGGQPTRLMPGAPHPPADSDLPDVRPARQSAPVPTSEPFQPATLPISRVDDFGFGDDLPSDGYSIGDDSELESSAPAMDFHAPEPIARTSDYTAEYAALRRRQSRWPIVLLALLLLVAGALIVLAALRPDLLGLPERDPAPVAMVDAGSVDAGPSVLAAMADAGQGDADPRDASSEDEETGAGAASDGDAAQAEGAANGEADDDEGAAEEADDEAEADEPEADEVEADEADDDARQVAAAAREPTPPTRDPTPAPRRDAAPEPAREVAPSRTSDTARAAARGDDDDEASSGAGYDGAMERGNDALRDGDPQEALNHFSAAADARPNSAEAHVGVAESYAAMGRHDLSAVRFQRATSVNSRYGPAWVGLGDARRRTGDVQGACEAYRRVLSIVSSGGSASRARRAVEALNCPE